MLTHVRRLAICVGYLACCLSTSQPIVARDREYVVVASEVRHQVDLKRLPCLLIVENGTHIYGKRYFDDSRIDRILQSTLPETVIQRSGGDCSRALYFTVLDSVTRAVEYRGHPSVLLMSFQICETEMGRISAETCTYKNLYLFEKVAAPFEAFEIGVRAFFKDQDKGWALMTITVKLAD